MGLLNGGAASAEAVAVTRASLMQSLLEVSIDLSASPGRREMLEMVLTEARRLSGAQGGSLYVCRGDRLEFVVAQNDVVDLAGQPETLLGMSLAVGGDSVAGFVAASGRAVNIPDTFQLPPGSPFRVDRRFDAAVGYRTRSILALPLVAPGGEVVGVLELVNRVGPDGAIGPFDEPEGSPIGSLATVAAVSVHNVLLSEQLKQARLDTIIRLAVVAEFRDQDTADHIVRMSHVCALTARAMDLPADEVELIQAASPMHDIGKVGIPDSILLKPAALTPDERRIVETHTLIGAEILASPSNQLMQTACDIALSHHERWDGNGYPHHLAGERIPLPARIACLADVFDALATRRCYKDAYPIEKVVQIIKDQTGRQFDPDVVQAFFNAFDDVMVAY